MGSFEARKANGLLNLNNLEYLAGEFQSRKSQLAILIEQRKTLEGKIQAGRAKKQDILQAAEAYEKEFMDRSASLKLPTQGFATLQDGILAVFFLAYFSAAIVIIYNTLKIGTNPFVAGLTGITLFVGGILAAELIRRFA